jgi:hypothetical protein
MLAFFGTAFTAHPVGAVRPFVTDDARIVDRGQVGVETYGQLNTSEGEKPRFSLRSLQGIGLTDRVELTVGGFGFEYRDRRAVAENLVVQPKVILHRSFGALPSTSVSAGTIIPISGNRQRWNNYSMAQASWYLFPNPDGQDPYDCWLSIYLNGGAKGQYDAGLGGRQTSKPFWAVGFEVGTFTRRLRFLGEVFNGDPFEFAEEFPAFQTGFRWYKSQDVQVDLAWKGVNAGHTGDPNDHWDYSLQLGLRIVFDAFR